MWTLIKDVVQILWFIYEYSLFNIVSMLEITWSEISLYSLYLEILSVHGISVYYCKTYKKGRCLGRKEGNPWGEEDLPQNI